MSFCDFLVTVTSNLIKKYIYFKSPVDVRKRYWEFSKVTRVLIHKKRKKKKVTRVLRSLGMGLNKKINNPSNGGKKYLLSIFKRANRYL